MMIFLEMVHHAQIGQASIFKQTQVILIESDLNATTDCSFDFHILQIFCLCICVYFNKRCTKQGNQKDNQFQYFSKLKKKSVTLIQNNLYFQGQIKPFLKKCMNMEKKILH